MKIKMWLVAGSKMIVLLLCKSKNVVFLLFPSLPLVPPPWGQAKCKNEFRFAQCTFQVKNWRKKKNKVKKGGLENDLKGLSGVKCICTQAVQRVQCLNPS